MTLLNYTDFVPTPPPVTTGTTVQSYVDPTGDVWVAKNGVNGGNWSKARDTLHCKVFRNAALTLATAVTTIACDGVITDVYGLYNTVNANAFTAPVSGMYQVSGQVAFVATAAAQWVLTRVYGGPAASPTYIVTAQNASAITSGTWSAGGATVYPLQAGQIAYLAHNASAALACSAGAWWTFLSVSYLGTG